MKLRLTVLLLAQALAFTTLSFAQGVATGDLRITVKDPKGGIVNNASVVARDQEKGVERTARINQEGEYSILALPPGIYRVEIEAKGFAKVSAEGVVITVGQKADLPITLAVAGAQEVVNVSSEAELVETQRTSSSNTIEQRRIDNLPINGRNYIQFAETDSQVIPDNAPSIGAA